MSIPLVLEWGEGERREKRKGNRERKDFVVARMEGREVSRKVKHRASEYFLTEK